MGPQIVLFLALLSLVPACAPQCRVQFCDASRTFPLGVSDRSLKPLCLHGTPLRNIQSGHARVVLGPRQVLLSNYSPQGLRQRFSPSFFKLYYKANGIGVGHETVQANQRDFLHARCIVLPIRGLRGVPNTASCVSYIVGTALSTPTATATPNSSPAPSSSSTPRSPTEATFSELTFATGEANRSTVVRTRDDRFGDSHYRLQYDVRVTPSGVVSLDDATPLISSVSCFTDGSINVVIKDSARAQLSGLADMYPRGAIIVVNRELYGPCQLQELTRAQQQTQENNDGDPTSAKNRALVDDGYLRIESVQGTPGNATIRGEPTAFPALFERARIILTNLAPLPPPRPSNGTANQTIGTTSVRQATTAADGSTTFGGAKTLELGLGLVQFDLKAQVENRGGFRVLDATIDSSGVNVEVSSVVDYTFTLEMLAKIRATLSPRSFKKSVDFISVPINGVKVGVSLEVSRRANSTNSVGIPLKFGTFFEIPIVLIAEIELSKDITTPGTAIFNSGRKEIKYFVTGPYRNLQYGSTPITNEKFSVSFDPPRLTGGILSSTDSPNKLSVSLFGGVRPKLAFYASFLEARISVDVGVELGVSGAIPGGAPFGPNSGIGASCDVCHLVDAEVNGVVQNFGFFLTNNLKFNGWLAKLLSKFIPQTLFSLTLPGNPTLKNNLLNTCFIPLPGASTGTEVCGETCCDPSKPEVCSRAGGLTGSAVCASSPTPVPTPSTPSPSPSPQPSPGGSTASTYTDPHIVTFDGLRYDCMATGEFILFKTGTVQIQGRFFGPSARGSVMTGIVAAEGSDKIQVTVQKNSTRPATIVAGFCPVNMFLNGNMQNVGTTSGAAGGIQLTFPRNDSVQISLPSGVLFSFRVRPSSFFGCYFEQNNAFAPTALTANQATVGLLGSPNGNPDDDWMTRNGTVLSPPSTLSGRLYEKAYNYCTKNWCITDSTDSLFTYANGMSHSDFNKCNLPYTRVDFSRVSAALRDLCGTNAECLTDGVVSGDIGEARNTLRVQSEVDVARLGPSAISVSPQAISTNTSTNIRVEVDLSKLGSGGIRTDVDSYNLYKIDSSTRAIIGSVLVVLTSSGSGAPGKKLFSNTFAVRSAITGETFSFVGHPVIKGAENRNAGLSVSSLEAVRSFSPVSGIGVAPSNATFTTVPSISNDTVLKAEYTWPLNEPDLDTATQFFAETVGFGCSSSATYMTFTGDDTSSGGKETVRIQLGKSRADGKWAKDVTILFGAGWYNGRGKGPATLRVVLENTAGSAISEVLQVALNPTNSGPSCAGPPISATLKIDVGAKTTLTLSV